MTIEQFETLSLYVCVGGLILYCMYIMHRLAKDSNAGRFGTMVIFLTLGLGIFAFIGKEIALLFIGG
jgi:hypothetical protein